MSTNYDQPDDTYSPADDEATIARIERYEAACVDGEITADDVMPDPDATEVRIGCIRDNEADDAAPTTKPADTDTFGGTCPTCGGIKPPRDCEPCPTCHGTGVK